VEENANIKKDVMTKALKRREISVLKKIMIANCLKNKYHNQLKRSNQSSLPFSVTLTVSELFPDLY